MQTDKEHASAFSIMRAMITDYTPITFYSKCLAIQLPSCSNFKPDFVDSLTRVMGLLVTGN
jgi:hypothetical protein